MNKDDKYQETTIQFCEETIGGRMKRLMNEDEMS